MEIKLKKVFEHDMDLLIMEEFVSSRVFADILLKKVCLPDNYEIHSAVHSLSDSDGESDITLILRYPDKKVAVLIEDKIDAQTMQNQSERYIVRGEKGKVRREYDEYFVILVAPREYHKEHINDKNAAYKYRVEYEELLDYFEKQSDVRSMFKAELVSFAIREKKTGYQVVEDCNVTAFWKTLREFCTRNYPKLEMLGEDKPRGASAVWPEFRTSLRTIKAIYKSQKGCVDLEFPRYGDRTADLQSGIKNLMSDKMEIVPAGKSASVRVFNEKWKVDFSQSFDDCVETINEVLQAVSELCELASKLNYSDLY